MIRDTPRGIIGRGGQRHRARAIWIVVCALVLAGTACRSGGSSQPARPDPNATDMTPARCRVDGREYEVGERFPAADGCNTCTCEEDGRIACTEIACIGCDPASEPHRRYVATSTDACAVIRFVCEADTHYFANECGCGCEDDAALAPPAGR